MSMPFKIETFLAGGAILHVKTILTKMQLAIETVPRWSSDLCK